MGLKGKALFMDDLEFAPNMSHEEALIKDIGICCLEIDNAISSFENHYNSLPNRPDWDGYISLLEANNWYNNS